MKRLLRLLLCFVILLVLISQFPWVSDTIGRFLVGIPELRARAYQEGFASFNTKRAFRSQFFIQNRGLGEARDVDLYIVVPEGVITRYDVLFQSSYEVDSTDAARGRLHLQLDRVASNGQVKLYLWGFQPLDVDYRVDFVVTARNGVVRELDTPTVTESMDSYVRRIVHWVGEERNAYEELASPDTTTESAARGGQLTTTTCIMPIIVFGLGIAAIVFFLYRGARKK